MLPLLVLAVFLVQYGLVYGKGRHVWQLQARRQSGTVEASLDRPPEEVRLGMERGGRGERGGEERGEEGERERGRGYTRTYLRSFLYAFCRKVSEEWSDLEDELEAASMGGGGGGKRKLREKFRQIQEILLIVQNVLGEIADTGERINK